MNTQESRKAVENFMFYMYNKWSGDECHKIYGKVMGDHLWAKWCNAPNELKWFSWLDDGNRDKLIARANECYDGMREIK